MLLSIPVTEYCMSFEWFLPVLPPHEAQSFQMLKVSQLWPCLVGAIFKYNVIITKRSCKGIVIIMFKYA